MRILTRFFSFGDRKLFYFLNRNINCSFFDLLMFYITKLGGVIFSIGLPVLLVSFGNRRIKLLGVEIIGSLIITTFFVQILKRTVSRERPYNILDNINTFDIEMKDHSFPSGHTAASFSIATMIYLNIPQLMTVMVFLAILVGISRIYLAVHYPSDVIVGIIIGSSSSILVNQYLLHYFI